MIELSSRFLKTSFLGNRSVELDTDDPIQHGRLLKTVAKRHSMRRIASISFYKGSKKYTSFIVSFNEAKDKEDFLKELKENCTIIEKQYKFS